VLSTDVVAPSEVAPEVDSLLQAARPKKHTTASEVRRVMES